MMSASVNGTYLNVLTYYIPMQALKYTNHRAIPTNSVVIEASVTSQEWLNHACMTKCCEMVLYYDEQIKGTLYVLTTN